MTSERLHVHVHADAQVGPASARYEQIAWFLEAHFGEVESDVGHAPVLVVRVDGEEARVNLITSVSFRGGAGPCADGAVGAR